MRAEGRAEICEGVLKVESSENKSGQKILQIIGYWPGTVTLNISSPCTENISVSGQYDKFTGDFWNNNRSATERFCASPIFPYPLYSTITIGAAIRASLIT